jgi:PadR family transcriptional regulator
MTPRSSLGDLEQMVLLAVLRLRDGAYAPDIAWELERTAARPLSRGALYATLERLASKELLAWEVEVESTGPGGHHRRRFRVTPDGVDAAARARATWLRLFDGLDDLIRPAE